MAQTGSQELDETAWLVVSAILEALIATKLVWKAAANQQEIKKFVLGMARSFRGVLKWPKRHRVSDAERLAVAKEVSKLRVSIARRYAQVLMAMGLAVVCSIQSNVILKRPRWMTAALTWLTLLSLASAACSTLHPHLALRSSTLDFWYMVGQCGVAACLWPPFVAAEHLTTIAAVLLVLYRLPASIMAQHSCLIVIGNLAMVLMTYLRTTQKGSEEIVEFAVQVEALCSTMVIALAFIMRSALERFAEQLVLSTEATTELNAASALLGLTCDAVLELDEHLRITTCSPQLATMLLRAPGNPSSMAGLSFTDFVWSREDKERAAQILNGNAQELAGQTETVAAKAFHTRLVDGCGSRFRTEVFQVSYRKPGGKVCHLVGIRDFTDQSSLAASAVDAIHEPNSVDAVGSSADLNEAQPLPLLDGPIPRIMLLELDMSFMQVCAASAPLASMADKSLSDVFSEEAVRFFQQLWDEVLLLEARGELARKAMAFGNVVLKLGPKKMVQISGSVEVTATATRELEMFLCFRSPPLLSQWINRTSRRSQQSTSSPAMSQHDSPASSENERASGTSFSCSL